jgi:hypothetical protein
MKVLRVSVEHIKEIIVNYSNIANTIVPKHLSISYRNDIIDGYSSIILSLLNTRLNTESRDYRVLNTIINKAQDTVITPELELFLAQVSMVVRDVLSMMNITIDIEQLITDLNTVINNVAREGVLGIYAVMDVSTFNTFRKHIFALSKEELSKDELLTYKKYMKTYIDWVVNEPKKYRLAINTITSNVRRDELKSRESIEHMSKVSNTLLGILENDYDRNVLSVAMQLLIYRNYWMVIPDEVMVLKIRRRLGRLTDRLLSSIYEESEFKIKKVENVR